MDGLIPSTEDLLSDLTFFLRNGDSYKLLIGLSQVPDAQFVIKGVSCVQQRRAGAGDVILRTSEAAVNKALCEAVVFIEPAMAATVATQSLAFGKWDAMCAILELVVIVGLKDFESQAFECGHQIHCVIYPPAKAPEIHSAQHLVVGKGRDGEFLKRVNEPPFL